MIENACGVRNFLPAFPPQTGDFAVPTSQANVCGLFAIFGSVPWWHLGRIKKWVWGNVYWGWDGGTDALLRRKLKVTRTRMRMRTERT